MRTSRNFASAIFLTFSFLGLFLVAAFINLSPTIQDDLSWRKPFVGTVFNLVCALGILAGIFPSKCSKMFHFKRTKQDEFTQEMAGLSEKPLELKGHHPNCGKFSAHVFRVNNRSFCAGCIGLILGALLSFFGAVLYFYTDLFLSSNYFLIFWIGFTWVSCGLLQYHVFNLGKSSIHLFVNTFFVFGVFLLLVGVDAITQSVIVDFYLIVLSVFWLYTRILLSQLDHKAICINCNVKECGFYIEKSMENG